MAANPGALASQPTNKTPLPIMPDLFQSLDGHADRHGLVGGYCSQCDRYFFPLTGQCPSCYGVPQRRVFGEHGQLYSFTVVRTKTPFALPEPYAVGYVDLVDVPLRVFALLDPAAIEHLAVGSALTLTAMLLGEDAQGVPCLRPVFCLDAPSCGKEAA